MQEQLPYGTWPSIISAADVAAASLRTAGATLVDGVAWWAEGVPAEQGRVAVFRDGADAPVLPAPWSASSRVHEYGGGAWGVTDCGDLVFVNGADQRLWLLASGSSEPRALTPDNEAERFGGLSVHGSRVVAVREALTADPVPDRDIVEIPLDGSAADDAGAIRSLVRGAQFYAQPRLSPAGDMLAWIQWNHPSMPWDDAAAFFALLDETGVIEPQPVSHPAGDVAPRHAVTQVEWTAQGDLILSDDPTGRWNLYRFNGTASEAIAPADADTGGPLWSLGARWFTVLEDGRIVAVRTNGNDELWLIGTDGSETRLASPITSGVEVYASHGSHVVAIGASVTQPTGVWVIDVDDEASTRCVRGGSAPWDEAWLPRALEQTFSGEHGEVHAFAYPPKHPDVTAPDGELPPYVLLAHGGPTGHTSAEISPVVAFFTSRGIGVLDVNYSGSTGYGREYRERLRRTWGVWDVDDMVTAAHGIVARGLADPKRLAIKGGSAGGLTVLGALVRGTPFSAGLSRYGVADLRSLLADTHDFEARYTESLVGAWPEEEQRYLAQSPLTRADEIAVPVLIMQGDLDQVVPPSQSEAIRDALAANGVAHRYIVFEGERHGFRQRESIIAATESELRFLATVFGFSPAGLSPLALD